MEVQFLPGEYKGKDVTIIDVFEAVGKHAAGTISENDLKEIEQVACPSAGSCGGQFTANTMACISEALGLALNKFSYDTSNYLKNVINIAVKVGKQL